MTIPVAYSCKTCGLEKAACDVRVRGAESVTDWIDHVMHQIKRDHTARSPECHGSRVDLQIPMDAGNDRIGGPTFQ